MHKVENVKCNAFMHLSNQHIVPLVPLTIYSLVLLKINWWHPRFIYFSLVLLLGFIHWCYSHGATHDFFIGATHDLFIGATHINSLVPLLGFIHWCYSQSIGATHNLFIGATSWFYSLVLLMKFHWCCYSQSIGATYDLFIGATHVVSLVLLLTIYLQLHV
jgi:hypothetical protein